MQIWRNRKETARARKTWLYFCKEPEAVLRRWTEYAEALKAENAAWHVLRDAKGNKSRQAMFDLTARADKMRAANKNLRRPKGTASNGR
jgi:hypothetical protein